VVSHDLGFVAEVAGRIVAMEDGRIAADRPARELLYDAEALAALELRPPATAEIARALALPGRPIRSEEVAAALSNVKWKQVSE